MGKILSNKEWLEWDGPFFWIKDQALFVENETKNDDILKEIIIKWCGLNLNGWTIYMDGYWMFEHKEEAAKVKSLIITGYFNRNSGELKEDE